jgi:hypothetical protein
MAQTPQDLTDLYLAPVVLSVDARLEELGKLAADQLAYEVALTSDRPDITQRMRAEALIVTIEHMIETHHWTLSWDPRGLRLSHREHTLVLGVPATLHQYLEGAARHQVRQ